MSTERHRLSQAWFCLLLRLYPDDFREELGEALLETYRDRARDACALGGRRALARLWLRALVDSLRNGLGERVRPAIAWRRGGNWARDAELVLRRLRRSPAFAAAVVATLSVGLGAFAAVYAVAHKVLVEPLPYARPDDLYYVWRNYTWLSVDRGWLAGTDIGELEASGSAVAGRRRYAPHLDDVVTDERRRATGDRGPRRDPHPFTVLGVRPLLGALVHGLGNWPRATAPGRPRPRPLADEVRGRPLRRRVRGPARQPAVPRDRGDAARLPFREPREHGPPSGRGRLSHFRHQPRGSSVGRARLLGSTARAGRRPAGGGGRRGRQGRRGARRAFRQARPEDVPRLASSPTSSAGCVPRSSSCCWPE